MKPIDLIFPNAEASHRHNIISEDGDYLVLEGHRPITKKTWTLRVKASGYQTWITGEFIQEAFPELNPEERELLLSGTSAEGWKIMFGEEA